MKYYAVIGDPILHSKSPIIYNYWFEKYGMEACYTRIAADNINDALYLFDELKLSGINVTAPYKEDAFKKCDDINQDALSIGAVNTILDSYHKKIGFNTDYYGVINTLKKHNIALKGQNVLIIGAGNAAKSALFALSDKKCKVTLANRNLERAKNTAKNFKSECLPLHNVKEAISKADLLINTLSSDYIKLDKKWFNNPNLVIFDAIYHQSKFKNIAEEKKLKYIPGTEWLLNQAIPSYKMFTGERSATTAKLKNLLEKNGQYERIYLIGFSASGKTTIGRELAALLNYQFIDTDEEVIKLEKCSINDIFEKHGEDYFREAETTVLKKTLTKQNAVISCGGGSVISETNRKYIKKNSIVIWLYSGFDVVRKRLYHDSQRPLISKSNRFRIQKLFDKRFPLYFKLSDLVINSEPVIFKVVNRLYDEIRYLMPKAENSIFEVQVPDSKSEIQREVAAALLNDNSSLLIFYSICDDTLTAIRLAYQIGKISISTNLSEYIRNCDLKLFSSANRQFLEDIINGEIIISEYQTGIINKYSVRVRSAGREFPKVINCGESGLSLNLFTCLAAVNNKEITIKAEGTLRDRKQITLIQALEAAGKKVESNNNKPPLKISGEINNFQLSFDTLESSQAISGLLMMYSSLKSGGEIKFRELKSKNYALMTIETLKKKGAKISYSDNEIKIKGSENINDTRVNTEGCWSSASFWIILAAVKDTDIKVGDLSSAGLQPDKAILDVIQLSGGQYIHKNGYYQIVHKSLKSFEYDCTNCPDLIPNLIIFAACMNGTSKIHGAGRLLNKESNRTQAILNEFKKLHIDVKLENDTFFVNKSKIKANLINYHNDHRIEMAAYLAYCIIDTYPVNYDKVTKSVGKSYVSFYDDLRDYRNIRNPRK